MFLQTSSLPQRSTDQLTLERLVLIPFTARFVVNPTQPHERQQNRDIDQLSQNAEFRRELFAWLVEGARKYYQEGLQAPPEVLQKTSEYTGLPL